MFHFPEIDDVFDPKQTEHSFMFANAIKVTPILNEIPKNDSYPTLRSYFPFGFWTSLNDFSQIEDSYQEPGMWREIEFFNNDKNMIMKHLMPGKLIPMYNITDKDNYETTADVEKSAPLNLVVNRDSNGYASGKLFLDDGISLSSLSEKMYEYYEFIVSAGSIKK